MFIDQTIIIRRFANPLEQSICLEGVCRRQGGRKRQVGEGIEIPHASLRGE